MSTICYCGHDLGEVTESTKGLCPECGTSIWMQVARRLRPDSPAIAQRLQVTGQDRCVHDQTHCISRCGVVLNQEGWVALSFERRQVWFSNVMNLSAQNRYLKLLRDDG